MQTKTKRKTIHPPRELLFFLETASVLWRSPSALILVRVALRPLMRVRYGSQCLQAETMFFTF